MEISNIYLAKARKIIDSYKYRKKYAGKVHDDRLKWILWTVDKHNLNEGGFAWSIALFNKHANLYLNPHKAAVVKQFNKQLL